MFVVFCFALLMLMLLLSFSLLMFAFLHTFFEFLHLSGITENVHQVDDLHVLVGSFCKSVFDPFIGLSAHIHEQVAGGYLNYIVSSRLIIVQVNTVVKEIGYFNIFCMASEDLLYPVVFGEDGANYAERL